MNSDEQNEMSLKEIRGKIIEFNNNSKIKEYYMQKSYLEILGVARRETSHSNFIAWILNPLEIHGLSDFGIKRLLEIIITNKFIDILKLDKKLIDIITTGNYNLLIKEIETEYSIGESKKDRIDIYLSFTLESDNYKSDIQIIIENKIKAFESDRQTDKYYDYFSKLKNNAIKIFLYLTPISNMDLQLLNEPQCINKNYMQINYQSLLDNLFQPALELNLNQFTYTIIEQYIKTLHRPAIDAEKGSNTRGIIMAYEKEEKELLKKFWETNEEIILAAVSILKEDDDIEPEQQELFKDIYKTISKKRKSPQLNFIEIGIPIGSELIFKNNMNVKSIVSANKTVRYKGEEKSLSALTKELLKSENSVRGTDYWLFNNKSIREYYDKKYKK